MDVLNLDLMINHFMRKTTLSGDDVLNLFLMAFNENFGKLIKNKSVYVYMYQHKSKKSKNSIFQMTINRFNRTNTFFKLYSMSRKS